MDIQEAAKIMINECSKIEGVEINFTGDNVDIYWENLRVSVDQKKLRIALRAIRTLNDLDARFE